MSISRRRPKGKKSAAHDHVLHFPPDSCFTISEIEIIYDALLFKPSVIGSLGVKHDLNPRLRYRLRELADGLELYTTYDMLLPYDKELCAVIPYALEVCEFFTHELDDLHPIRYQVAKLSLESIYKIKIPSYEL